MQQINHNNNIFELFKWLNIITIIIMIIMIKKKKNANKIII